MKGIYRTIIFFAVMSAFSLAASAQAPGGSQNTVANRSTDGSLIAFDAVSGNKAKAKSKIRKESSSSIAIEPAPSVNPSSLDNDQVNPSGLPVYKLNEFDRYGYQGLPLSTHSRPCLVSGARRCVQ